MMKPKWQKPLNKAELKHLRAVAGCHSLKQFKETIEIHKMDFDKNIELGMLVGIAMPCWECRNIARKLGLWD